MPRKCLYFYFKEFGCNTDWLNGMEGGSKRAEGNRNLQKSKKSLPICLLQFSNNVDLKKITVISKTILNFLGAQIAAINLFQFDLDKSRSLTTIPTVSYCYEKAPPPPFPSLKKQGGSAPIFQCPWPWQCENKTLTSQIVPPWIMTNQTPQVWFC